MSRTNPIADKFREHGEECRKEADMKNAMIVVCEMAADYLTDYMDKYGYTDLSHLTTREKDAARLLGFDVD